MIIPKMRILLVVLLISQTISRTSLLCSSDVILYIRLDDHDRISKGLSSNADERFHRKAKAEGSGPF
jgi:hypothetical protein